MCRQTAKSKTDIMFLKSKFLGVIDNYPNWHRNIIFSIRHRDPFLLELQPEHILHFAAARIA